ncbi:hypothetical protein PFISCL1PPCAC_7296 [Pristionchus fissidentatus]|uniref:Uncharacterized protein n=1 Tax=Pristionchus fissidentatus TaxID=1538716 RepID=A0AAV5VDL0_9BILA|nr:hypothetical protein PFISCL1PPCAC_7296 [Pristionchus fissidentatus]
MIYRTLLIGKSIIGCNRQLLLTGLQNVGSQASISGTCHNSSCFRGKPKLILSALAVLTVGSIARIANNTAQGTTATAQRQPSANALQQRQNRANRKATKAAEEKRSNESIDNSLKKAITSGGK